MIPGKFSLSQKDTHRIIPSRYPTVGIFDDLVSPKNLHYINILESLTNDRINTEHGKLYNLPQEDWVYGISNAIVIMAAFCHPNPKGGRFNDNTLGAWYSALSLETAFKETAYHRTQEFLEVGDLKNKFIHMRQYLSDFDSDFFDVRNISEQDPIYDSDSYKNSQAIALVLKALNANGIIYRSVRDKSGECIVCYKPKLVLNVRQGDHYEYRWQDSLVPIIKKIN